MLHYILALLIWHDDEIKALIKSKLRYVSKEYTHIEYLSYKPKKLRYE